MADSGQHEGRQRWQARYDEAKRTGTIREAGFTTLPGVEVGPVYRRRALRTSTESVGQGR